MSMNQKQSAPATSPLIIHLLGEKIIAIQWPHRTNALELGVEKEEKCHVFEGRTHTYGHMYTKQTKTKQIKPIPADNHVKPICKTCVTEILWEEKVKLSMKRKICDTTSDCSHRQLHKFHVK